MELVQPNCPEVEHRPNGLRLNLSNLHSKHPSGIAIRMKALGVDWLVPFAAAIKKNDKTLLRLWLRLLPYLVVTQGHKRIRKMKGRASKAALTALDALEKEC
jgi:hypothetical protein